MKKMFWRSAATILLFSAAILGWWIRPGGREAIDPQLLGRQLLTVERIQSLSELTTLKVDVADARVTRLQGRTGSVQAVLVVQGEVIIGVDLASARFEQVNRTHNSAVLVLPDPKVQSMGLDHERTKLIGVWQGGLWEIVPGGQEADTAAVNLGYRDAQRALGTLAGDRALLDRARRQAQDVLQAFFIALGWDVTIRWANQTPSENQ
ncbi:MAG TPA: DUF4230 domain-containing protein [Tepidisphaeraceae bacterium]|jgi:hypothetical protein|nr:DUF4230 domain-containing protein [Tepidisphaeraceae bacterium]